MQAPTNTEQFSSRRDFLRRSGTVLAGAVLTGTITARSVAAESNVMKIAGACTISVLPDRVIHPRFGGVGFHCSEHEHAITRDLMDRVLAKRWRELRPSFASKRFLRLEPGPPRGSGGRGTVPLKNGTLVDTVAPLSLTVYTTDYDNDPPAPVRGVKVEAEAAERRRVTWQASVEPDFCYYRIYRGARAGFMPTQENQVGSTIATEFLDAEGGKA